MYTAGDVLNGSADRPERLPTPSSGRGPSSQGMCPLQVDEASKGQDERGVRRFHVKHGPGGRQPLGGGHESVSRETTSWCIWRSMRIGPRTGHTPVEGTDAGRPTALRKPALHRVSCACGLPPVRAAGPHRQLQRPVGGQGNATSPEPRSRTRHALVRQQHQLLPVGESNRPPVEEARDPNLLRDPRRRLHRAMPYEHSPNPNLDATAGPGVLGRPATLRRCPSQAPSGGPFPPSQLHPSARPGSLCPLRWRAR